MEHPNLIADTDAAKQFIFGGRARFTLVSKATGKRYTYRMGQSKDGQMFFASLLVGQNNEADYEYLGFTKPEMNGALFAGKKGNPNHPAYRALDWALRKVFAGKMPGPLEIWHEGRCGRCGRALTDPASIETGFGPECINHV